MRLPSRDAIAISHEAIGLPWFSTSSSRRASRAMVAQPAGAQFLFANRKADRLNRNTPPVRPCASRATQKPNPLRPMKNSGIEFAENAAVGPPREICNRGTLADHPTAVASRVKAHNRFPSDLHASVTCRRRHKNSRRRLGRSHKAGIGALTSVCRAGSNATPAARAAGGFRQVASPSIVITPPQLAEILCNNGRERRLRLSFLYLGPHKRRTWLSGAATGQRCDLFRS